mgnify:CR=1 FL=1
MKISGKFGTSLDILLAKRTNNLVANATVLIAILRPDYATLPIVDKQNY